MAHFKLSEKVWYGNMDAPIQLRGQYKSILDLSKGYIKPPYHYTIDQVDCDQILMFRLPITEDEPADDKWAGMLCKVVELVSIKDAFPILVHCFAGQCRAPITAVFLEWWMGNHTKHSTIELLDRMRELSKCHGVDEKRLYHASLRELMLQFPSQGVV